MKQVLIILLLLVGLPCWASDESPEVVPRKARLKSFCKKVGRATAKALYGTCLLGEACCHGYVNGVQTAQQIQQQSMNNPLAPHGYNVMTTGSGNVQTVTVQQMY